jgi:uncharacterized membrane protein YgdD (TMEM256/DUF423 family)
MSLAMLGAVFAALGVIMGAFGAHGLKRRLEPEALAWWTTGAEYHLVHAIGVVALTATNSDPLLARAATLLLVGVCVFSGSLYAMALTGVRRLGAITPVGGLALIAGWVLAAIALSGRA